VRNQRRKIWIDRFQTYLSIRLVIYFALYQAAVWLLVFIERSIFETLSQMLGKTGVAYSLMFAVVTVVFLGLLLIYDAVKLTHRIVGPLYRFRMTVKAIAAGEEVDLVRLRKGDYLTELQDDFNEMIQFLAARGAVAIKQPAARQEQKQAASAS
jgi:nitrogen fixation/metabolism regulation signal transduction histidine kinase